MNRILMQPEEWNSETDVVLLNDVRAEHMRRVLKVQPGQQVRVGLLNGPTGCAEVLEAGPDGVRLRCLWENTVPNVPRVDLLLAAPRPKVLKRLWAQLAAIGAGRIYITNAEKVERNYFDTHVLEDAFIRAQLIEGLQQCGDTRLPQVSVHRRLKVLLEDELGGAEDTRLRLIADPGAERRIGGAVMSRHPERVLLAVGPEGGWTAYERALFEKHGFASVSTGARILRSDTACIALMAVVYEALEKPDAALDVNGA